MRTNKKAAEAAFLSKISLKNYLSFFLDAAFASAFFALTAVGFLIVLVADSDFADVFKAAVAFGFSIAVHR